jgi:hypothetical protein
MEIAGDINIIRRDDPVTAREMRDMFDSRAFAQYSKRLREMIARELQAIEAADESIKWRKAQGALRALRAVDALPTSLQEEFYAKEKKR